MATKLQIRLSGTGGQGLILGGIMLGDAAILDGKEVIQTQSYGPEARGGASKAEVIISDGEILYPKVVVPDFLLLMSQEAAKLYAKSINPKGLIVVDDTLVKELPPTTARVLKIPITQLAREKVGSELTANMLAIGAIAVAGRLATRESLEKVIENRLKRVAGINLNALSIGWELGEKF